MGSNLHLAGRLCLALLLLRPALLAAQAPCPPEAGRRLESAWSAYRADSLEAARERFAAVTRDCPAVADAWAGLGFATLRLGDAASAERAFRRALEVDRRSADAWDGLAHALARSGRNAEAIAAARQALAVAPAYASSRALLSRLDPDWDRPPLAPKPRPDSLMVAARVRGTGFEVPGAGGWELLWLRGVNLGAALPGRFPAEFPTDSALYRGWLDSMAVMGASVVRIYTIFPPAFYRALRARNLAYPARPLRLVQGIWAELPPGDDFDDPTWLGEFRAEMRRAVEVIHGAAAIPPVPGHAAGRYDADISPWVVAWIIGREWEPFAVAAFDEGRPRQDYRGRWLEGDSLPAMDRWLAEQCDYLLAHEVERFNAIRPVAYTSWPTLDPLRHPTESGAEEEAGWRRRAGRPLVTGRREYENDRIGLDANLVRPTAGNPAGWFASYHAYPYYPDFLLHDSAYAAARSGFGPSNYFGYLRDLVRHHAGLPVVIAEFGVPSSRGLAHWQPQGFTHGGLDERAQAAATARLAAEIRESGAAGALVFAWLDEWFKHNWVTIDLEVPRDHNPRWLNVEDAEQQYGLLGLYAGDGSGPRLGGDPATWRALPAVQQGEGPLLALRLGHDEAYVYLAIEADSSLDLSRQDLAVALDVVRPDLGQRRLPGGLRSEVGFEFLLELHDTARAALRALPEYNPYTGREALEDGDERGRFHRRPVRPVARDDGRWDSLLVIVNRARYGRDGTFFPARLHDRGRLRHGTQAESSLADWYWDRTAGLVTIRIPWALLNVTDPSTRRVAFEFAREGEFGAVATDGFRAGVLLLDEGGTRLDALPAADGGRWRAGEFTAWRWSEWTEPRFHWRLKPAFESLRQLWSEP
jgi:hypothetical protein